MDVVAFGIICGSRNNPVTLDQKQLPKLKFRDYCFYLMHTNKNTLSSYHLVSLVPQFFLHVSRYHMVSSDLTVEPCDPRGTRPSSQNEGSG